MRRAHYNFVWGCQLGAALSVPDDLLRFRSCLSLFMVKESISSGIPRFIAPHNSIRDKNLIIYPIEFEFVSGLSSMALQLQSPECYWCVSESIKFRIGPFDTEIITSNTAYGTLYIWKRLRYRFDIHEYFHSHGNLVIATYLSMNGSTGRLMSILEQKLQRDCSYLVNYV
jgi:hypothetical protein